MFDGHVTDFPISLVIIQRKKRMTAPFEKGALKCLSGMKMIT